MSESVRVAMVQDNFLAGDINGNARKIIELARRAIRLKIYSTVQDSSLRLKQPLRT